MKERIILVHYINTSNWSPAKTSEVVNQYMASLNGKADDILHFVFPMHDVKSRIECINPTIVSGQEYENALKVLTDNEKLMKRYITSPELSIKYNI